MFPCRHQLLPRHYATAAAQLAAEDGEEGVVAAGCLVEFERSKQYLLGLVVKQLPGSQGWQVENAK